MIRWLKRLAPFAAIAALWFGIDAWNTWRIARAQAEIDHYALLTARIWVGTAEFRHDPERYLAWRDSLLQAEGTTAAELDSFVARYESEPERLLPYAQRVKHLVDSIVASLPQDEPSDTIQEGDDVTPAGDTVTLAE